MSDDLLESFFGNVDKVIKDWENRGRPNRKNPNAIKKYKPIDDNPIKQMPNLPEKVVLHWTELRCKCGKTHSHPTYGHTPAFIHWPNRSKKGVVDIIPLKPYQHIPAGLPMFEEWQIHSVSICPSCFTGAAGQLQLFQYKEVSIETKEITIKPELPSQDIRDYLDDPNVIILEDMMEDKS